MASFHDAVTLGPFPVGTRIGGWGNVRASWRWIHAPRRADGRGGRPCVGGHRVRSGLRRKRRQGRKFPAKSRDRSRAKSRESCSRTGTARAWPARIRDLPACSSRTAGTSRSPAPTAAIRCRCRTRRRSSSSSRRGSRRRSSARPNLPRFYRHHYPKGSPADLNLTYEGLAPTGPLPASVDFPLSPPG